MTMIWHPTMWQSLALPEKVSKTTLSLQKAPAEPEAEQQNYHDCEKNEKHTHTHLAAAKLYQKIPKKERKEGTWKIQALHRTRVTHFAVNWPRIILLLASGEEFFSTIDYKGEGKVKRKNKLWKTSPLSHRVWTCWMTSRVSYQGDRFWVQSNKQKKT